MDLTPLISVDELNARLREARIRILDCRFELSDPGAGQRAYALGHIPGAQFVDLEQDLSDMRQVATRGRHPLPTDGQLSVVLGRIGAADDSELVCYDAGEAMYAARAWWLFSNATGLRVRVLDGGLKAWQAAGYTVSTETPSPAVTQFQAALRSEAWIAAEDISEFQRAGVLIDARGAPRFRGEVEPIDPIAGHVPGAINAPFTDNLRDGRFKPGEELAVRFRPLIGQSAAQVAHMCGSGVTACHNLLAMELAGLKGSRLFADSWSGWITDPTRPIATGG